MTKEELTKIIIDNFYNKKTNAIDLRELDFKDMKVFLSKMKAKEIWNGFQVANIISNGYQTAKIIKNSCQKANEIDNYHQTAEKITNEYQGATTIDNNHQKANSITSSWSSKEEKTTDLCCLKCGSKNELLTDIYNTLCYDCKFGFN